MVLHWAPLATLTLFLLVLLNPTTSRDMRPTAGIPALTSRAGTSLSFVFLTPPAASLPRVLRSSVSVWFTHSGAPVFRLAARVPRVTVSVCSLAGASLRVRPLPSAGGYHFLAPERGGSLSLPFVFRYLCAVSRLPASVPQYSSLEVFICRDPDVSSCISC